MSISEALMAPGSFDLELVPQTPKWVRDIVQPFGHIVIHHARVDPRTMTDVDLLADAIYCGVLRRKPTPFKLSGAHITLWLGDEEGKGSLITSGPSTLTFANWAAQILTAAAPAPVVAGTISAVGVGTVTQTFTRVTQRAALDWLSQYFGGPGLAEYRVRTDRTNRIVLDAGPPSGFYNQTPTVIAMPREGGREDGGGLVGIPPDQFDPAIDADSYTTDIVLVGAAGTGTATVGPAPYQDLRGNTMVLKRVVSSPQTTAGQENAVAAAQLLLYPLRNELALSSQRYDIPYDVKVGDWLYVYDPEHDLQDLTNPQNYRGQVVYPLKLRLYGLTWPVEGGMGVYYRPGGAAAGSDYTDITTYLVPESAGTIFEVGAQTRGLTATNFF